MQLPPALHSPGLQKPSGLDLTPVALPVSSIVDNERKLDSSGEGATCRGFLQCSAQANSSSRRSERLQKDIGCHITYALPATECSHLKPNSQALLIQTEHTLNKDCSRALLYSTHAISKGLFAWLDFVWVKALMVALCSDSY